MCIFLLCLILYMSGVVVENERAEWMAKFLELDTYICWFSCEI